MTEGDGLLGFGVLPLEMFQPDDEKQMDVLFQSLYRSPEVVIHHLTKFVFPAVMHHQELKLMASGCDLGGDMLFGVRLGTTLCYHTPFLILECRRWQLLHE